MGTRLADCRLALPFGYAPMPAARTTRREGPDNLLSSVTPRLTPRT
jgi:hypothetical protein